VASEEVSVSPVMIINDIAVFACYETKIYERTTPLRAPPTT